MSDYSHQKLPPEHLTELDKWMIVRTQDLQEEIRQDYLNYIYYAFQKIHACANDSEVLFGYLNRLAAKADSYARRSCQLALSNILQALLR